MFNKIYEELINTVNDKKQCIVLTQLHLDTHRNGSIDKKVIITNEDLEKKVYPFDESLYQKISHSFDSGQLQYITDHEKKAYVIEPVIRKPRLLVFGGGHIAIPLTEFASRVGFAVTVIDDRPYFANPNRFLQAEKTICESFEKSFESIALKESDYVVIITRGHRYDGVVLRNVLRYPLSYIGMIGSKRRVQGMMEELLKEGYSKEKLNEVNSPIGLSIGAITTDEIAISIVAQLIDFKNKNHRILPEFEAEIAKSIVEESTTPKALITILSSKGSVPRKAGAKMIAYLDGRTIGSIGGGCSEAAVITSARKLMQQPNHFLIEHVDMTGDVAESEGMVCGGVMEVLVEIL